MSRDLDHPNIYPFTYLIQRLTLYIKQIRLFLLNYHITTSADGVVARFITI